MLFTAFFCSASLHSSQAAKLKCVLNYFDRSFEQEDDSGVSAVICLTRQVSDDVHKSGGGDHYS